MNRYVFLPLICFLILPFIWSCSKENEEMYPSIVTEMADLYSNSSGSVTRFVLDDGREFQIDNPQTGFHPKSLYRVLCGYQANGNNATVYQLEGVYILRDSTDLPPKQDPVDVISVWRTPRYVNLHLAPKTQGLAHFWGFITDSIISTPISSNDTLVHAYLSLYHDQRIDPKSYTEDKYASLPLDSIKPFKGKREKGRITLSINTFSGKKTIEL